METLGSIIKRRRLAMGLTQRELAELVGISHTYIYQLEKGRNDIPSPDVMARLAKTIDISEVRLLRAVGYLQNAPDADGEILVQDELSGEELWDELKHRFGEDEDTATRVLYDALGIAIRRRDELAGV